MTRTLVIRLIAILVTAALSASAARTYALSAISPPPGFQNVSIAGMNASGQVAGTFSAASTNQTIAANFLYSPGVGITNIEGNGPPSPSGYEGSPVVAINNSAQTLLYSGLLYTPGQSAPQNLMPVVAAAFPPRQFGNANLGTVVQVTPVITFAGFNDRGEVIGTAIYSNSTFQIIFNGYIFRYSPGNPPRLVTAFFDTNGRGFPSGPDLIFIDDPGNVIFSYGNVPFGATVFTQAGATIGTGCGFPGNGWASAINNSGQIGGGWGKFTTIPAICTLAPGTFQGQTTFLAPFDSLNAGIISSLNNMGDAVLGPFSIVDPPVPVLFTNGQMINVNTLFPVGAGWVARTTDHINDAGQIAGVGTLNGVPGAYVLSPSPPTSYTLRNICDYSCSATLLSNSGSAVVFEQFPSIPQFAVISRLRGVMTIPSSAKGVNAMNDRDEIAGVDLLGRAFVSSPPYTELENLNSVFGWSSGSAVGINDGGDLIGSGTPANFGSLFPGLNVTGVYQINSARQITGSYLNASNNTHYFLYSPVSGIAELGGKPLALSSEGHVLIQTLAGSYGIQTTNATIALPSGYIWQALNNQDEVVGDAVNTMDVNRAFLYSANRGLVRLAALVTSPGYYLTSAVAINDGGEILANIESTDLSFQTSALLIPDAGSSTTTTTSNTLLSSRSSSLRGSSVLRSLNGVQIGVADTPRRIPTGSRNP
jgi:hypothetical protein